MSSAALKFPAPQPQELDPSILMTAMDALPQHVAIAESGEVIFGNP
jgi:hypothetical protein